MNAALMSESELEMVEGGPIPLVVWGAAALLTMVGGCSVSCSHKEPDGTETTVEIQIGQNSN